MKFYLPWPLGPSRYVRHLEAEIEWLKTLLPVGGGSVTAKLALERAKKPAEESVPASIRDLCARFESQGEQLLQECKAERKQFNTPWHVIEQRLIAYIAQHSPPEV